MVLVLKVSRVQKLLGHHPDFKRRQGFQAECPDRAMFEAVRIKPNAEWWPYEVEDVMNMEHLLRNATVSEWSHPKREAMRAANGKTIAVGLCKLFGVHIIQLAPGWVARENQDLMFALLGFGLT